MNAMNDHICLILTLASLVLCLPGAAGAKPAAAISDKDCLRDFAPGVFAAPLFVQLADGTFLGYEAGTGAEAPCVMARTSHDGGLTWSAPELAVKGLSEAVEAVVDKNGEMHLFSIEYPDPKAPRVEGGEGERPLIGQLVKRRLDIWYSRSSGGRSSYSAPRMIWKGYTGALNSIVLTRKGRILLPFSFLTDRTWRNRGGGFKEFTFTGQFDSTLIYTDDLGRSWHAANNLSIVTPDIVSAYGAVEPVVVELSDRIWMLIRGQTGRFYESSSFDDGKTWSVPKPSGIVSSDSPAGLVKLSDGRLVLLWNCCKRYPYAYGGRQVLHAAISADEGKTWRGFREVARDRLRNQPPPPTGDHGTAYPFPVATKDDRVLFRTGQGEGRVEVKILDPSYLYQTRQKTDWSARLEDWSVYGTKGVGLELSAGSLSGQALAVRRADAEFPAAAVWNFPMGARGKLKLRVKLEPGTKGFRLGLTNHYSPPFDAEDVFNNIFNISLAASKANCPLPAGKWCSVGIQWDTAKGTCAVEVDGKRTAGLSAARSAQGICYLRLTATSDQPEPAGLLLDGAEVEIAGAP